ncbi:unnamed protein product, partial [marine sediment metagenome]
GLNSPFPPFLDRKGVRGLVERIFHRLARMIGSVKAFVRHYTSGEHLKAWNLLFG